MKKTWTTGLLVLVVLISGCTYGTKTAPQPPPIQPSPTTPATTSSASAAMVEIKGYAFNPAT